jgi:hypothetical protein
MIGHVILLLPSPSLVKVVYGRDLFYASALLIFSYQHMNSWGVNCFYMVYLFGRHFYFFYFFFRGEGVLVNMRLVEGIFFPCPSIYLISCFCSEPMFLLFPQKKRLLLTCMLCIYSISPGNSELHCKFIRVHRLIYIYMSSIHKIYIH